MCDVKTTPGVVGSAILSAVAAACRRTCRSSSPLHPAASVSKGAHTIHATASRSRNFFHGVYSSGRNRESCMSCSFRSAVDFTTRTSDKRAPLRGFGRRPAPGRVQPGTLCVQGRRGILGELCLIGYSRTPSSACTSPSWASRCSADCSYYAGVGSRGSICPRLCGPWSSHSRVGPVR